MSCKGKNIGTAVVAAMLVGCGAGDGAVGSSSSAIAGGVVDSADTAVVGILDLVSGTMADLCSGVLIAPNAVLTARHCVSDVTSLANGDIDCAMTTVGAARSARNFRVTTASTFTASSTDFLPVSEVLIPPNAGNAFCGSDLAILILSGNVPASVAVPLVPSLGALPTAGQAYSAIGDGLSGPTTMDVGTRRRRDGLQVSCVGIACASPQVASSEFAGNEGVCSGDSGGPAIDSTNLIIGIASRGTPGCQLSVYEAVAADAAFLQGSVVHAAAVGGYAPPTWAAPAATTPQTPASGSGGCSLSRGPAGGGAPMVLVVVLLLVLLLLFVSRLIFASRRRRDPDRREL